MTKKGTYRPYLRTALRLKELRHGMTQGEFAKSVGMSKSTYSRFETGVRLPRTYILKKISQFTGVSEGSIIYGETNSKTLSKPDLETLLEAEKDAGKFIEFFLEKLITLQKQIRMLKSLNQQSSIQKEGGENEWPQVE